MFAPVDRAQEEGTALVCQDGLPPPVLDALDFEILSRWRSHCTWSEIAQELGIKPATVRARANRPIFKATIARLQKAWFDQLARGEFGGLAYAKANLIGNLKRLQGLARASALDTVKFNATVKMIEFAGMQPPKPQTSQSPETLLDQMTPDELAHFAETNEFPRRLGDQLARVAATVLQARDRTIVEGEATAAVPDAEWEPADPPPEPDEAPRADPAPEVEDREGPRCAALPDETALDEDDTE